MTPEYWKKIGDLVEQALTFDGKARQDFLSEACAGDAALQAQVEQFILAYEQDKDFLEETAIPGFTLENAPSDVEQIGDYKILRSLGRGGMGEVFLAQRVDSPVTHPVALKIIRRSDDYQDFTLSRFIVEQQILSELVHPNIARMLDAGSTEDGRPFFVMEYVDGLPITEYCEHHQLSIDERLQLFIQVCNAVQFAHHNLVVHRDIKPGNLLVTQTGQVKLLDFGIAKALSPWQQGASSLETQTGFRVLTPPYASPEQLTGNPMTTASDVYSLGVLLYEILTGRRPHELANLLEFEMVRVVLEEEPEAPSEAILKAFEKKAEAQTETISPDRLSATRKTTPERLHRKLRGELDHIVLMALRKEPTRRYNAASGLGDDVRRHLEGLSVQAQPDTLKYRVGKFVRRHRVGVSVVSTLIIILAALATATTIQSVKLGLEKERVQTEAAKSERVVQVLVELFEMSDPSRVPGGDTLRIADFLQRGEAKLLSGLHDEPEVQANVKQVLGKMYRVQGNAARSVALLRDALDQQRELKGPDDLASIHMLHDLAASMYRVGKRDTSILLYREAERRFRDSKLDVREHLANLLLGAAPRLAAGEREEKERMLIEANEIIASLESPGPLLRASAANQLGVFYYNQGLPAKARAPFEEALNYMSQVVDSTDGRFLVTAGNLGSVLTSLGEYRKARQLIEHVTKVRRRRNSTSFGFAYSLAQLGNLNYLEENWNEAVALKKEAYRIVSQTAPPGHERIANFALGYATTLVKIGQFDEANRLYGQALEIRSKVFGPESLEVALVMIKQGELFRKQRRWLEAAEVYEKSLERLLLFDPSGEGTTIATTQLALGISQYHLNMHGAALQYFQKALAFREAVNEDNVEGIAEVRAWTGAALVELKRYKEARPLLEAGYPIYKSWISATNEHLKIFENAIRVAQAS